MSTLLAALGMAIFLGCAPQAPDLPDFPKYEQADAFLEMQRRTQVQRPTVPPDPFEYSERNRSIYRNLEEQKRLSNAEMEMRARIREDAQARNRNYNQGQWDALQQRLARDEALDALREQEYEGNSQRFRAANEERFQNYHGRLERLAQRQEELARQRQIFEYQNQQRVGQRLEELRQRQAQGLQQQAAEAAQQGTPAAP